MAEKKSWSKDETISLIKHWELYPELWDVKCKQYRNRIKKQNALKELATEFSTEESEITRKLHNLRTQFHQEIRRMKMKKSGEGTDDDVHKVTWYFFNAMKFISCDRTDPISIDERDEYRETATEGNGSTNNREEIDNCEKNDHSERKKPKRNDKQNETERAALITTAVNLMNKPVDEFQIFGDFVATELRNLRSYECKRQLKLTIQRAIIQFCEMDSSPSTSGNNS